MSALLAYPAYLATLGPLDVALLLFAAALLVVGVLLPVDA